MEIEKEKYIKLEGENRERIVNGKHPRRSSRDSRRRGREAIELSDNSDADET